MTKTLKEQLQEETKKAQERKQELRDGLKEMLMENATRGLSVGTLSILPDDILPTIFLEEGLTWESNGLKGEEHKYTVSWE